MGAAIEDADGRIHTGCNVENATYGLTLCAERVAVFKAISEGVRKFRRVAVAADTDDPDAALRRLPADPLGVLRRRGNRAGQPARQNRNLAVERALPEALRCLVSLVSSSLRSGAAPPNPPTGSGARATSSRMDAQRRVIENGAVAIRGDRIVGGRHEGRDRRALSGEAAARPARRHPGARADQHPHPRRDVASSAASPTT